MCPAAAGRQAARARPVSATTRHRTGQSGLLSANKPQNDLPPDCPQGLAFSTAAGVCSIAGRGGASGAGRSCLPALNVPPACQPCRPAGTTLAPCVDGRCDPGVGWSGN
jgi:hypothetical protein